MTPKYAVRGRYGHNSLADCHRKSVCRGSIPLISLIFYVWFTFTLHCCAPIATALSTRVHPTSSSPANGLRNLIAKSSLSPPTNSTRRFRSRPVDVVIRDDNGQRVDQSPALPFTLGGSTDNGDVDGLAANSVDPSRKPTASSFSFAQRIRVDSGSRVLLFCETKDDRVAYLAWNDRSGRELFGSVARFSDGLLQNELRLILRTGNAAFYPNTHEQDYICRAMDQQFNVLGLAVVQYHVITASDQPKKGGGKTEKKLLQTSSTFTTPTTTQVTKTRAEKEKQVLPTQKLPAKSNRLLAPASTAAMLPTFVDPVNKSTFLPTQPQKFWIPPSATAMVVSSLANNNRAINQNGVMGSPLPYHQHQHFNIDNANVLHSYAHEEPPPSAHQQQPPYFSAAESSAHQDFTFPSFLAPPHLPPHIVTVTTGGERQNSNKRPIQFYHEHAYESDRPTPPRILPAAAAPPQPPPPLLPPLPTFQQQESTPSPPKFFPLLTTPTPLPMEPSSLPPLRLPIQSHSSPFAGNDENNVLLVTSTPVVNFFIPTMAPSLEKKTFYTTTPPPVSTASSIPERSSKTLTTPSARVQVNIVEGNATVMVDHDVTLNCHATVTGRGSAPAIITWWLGSSLIRNNNGSSNLMANFETTSDIIVNSGDANNATITTRGRLKFKAAQTLHDEKIWCRAISALVQSPTMSADESRKLAAEMAIVLNVVFTPLVQAGNKSLIVTKEEANVSLPCYMRANPSIDVIRWYKNARLIVEEELTPAQLSTVDDNYLSLHQSTVATTALPTTRQFGPPTTVSTNNWMTGATTPAPSTSNNYQVAWLEMSNLQRDDIGAYACQAKNALGWGSRSEPLELVIHYKPGAAHPHEHATIDASPGETVTLKCDVVDSGNPAANEFIWRKDGKFIGRGAHFVVKNAGAWDFGTYSCAAVNSVGEGKPALLKLKLKDEEKQTTLPYFGKTANLISDPAVDSSADIAGDSASSSTSSLARKIFFFHQAETSVILLAGIFALFGLIILIAVIVWCICRSVTSGRGCWCCCAAPKKSRHVQHHRKSSYETRHNNANCCPVGGGGDTTDSEHSRATPPPVHSAHAAAAVGGRSHSNSTSPSKLSDTESAVFPPKSHNTLHQRPNASLLLPWTYHPHMLPRAHLAPTAAASGANAASMFFDNKNFTDGSRDSSPVQQQHQLRRTANVSLHHHQPLAQTSEQHVHDIINLDARHRQSRRSSHNGGGENKKPQKKRYFASSSRNVNKITLTGGGTSAAVATVMKRQSQITASATTESTLASAYSSPRSLTNYQPCWLVNNNANGTNMSPTVTRSVKRFSEDDENNFSSQIIGGLQRPPLVGSSPWDWKSYRY